MDWTRHKAPAAEWGVGEAVVRVQWLVVSSARAVSQTEVHTTRDYSSVDLALKQQTAVQRHFLKIRRDHGIPV